MIGTVGAARLAGSPRQHGRREVYHGDRLSVGGGPQVGLRTDSRRTVLDHGQSAPRRNHGGSDDMCNLNGRAV